MKICYVDESGNQTTDPCLVMAGILVDAARLHRTREEFGDILEMVQGLFQESLKELKGSKMLFGRDRWRKIDPAERKRIAERLCHWLQERKHNIVLSAVDKSKFAAAQNATLPPFCADPWLAAATHVALQVQKGNQGMSHNKGVTFLVFDENKAKADGLAELLWDPPTWTDDYYQKKKKQERLDQLIDSAFTVKSHHAGLVQAADVYAFIFRRYTELNDFGSAEEWAGEKALIQGYVGTLKARLLAKSIRWPSRTASACSKWFNSLAPSSLVALGS